MSDYELIKNDDGSISKVVTIEETVETLTKEDMVNIQSEIDSIHLAISDIENFKKRRIDNLNDRLAELQKIKILLQGDNK